MSNDTAKRRAELLQKIEACTTRIQVTQARIEVRRAAHLDTRDDENWLATELDLLGILVDVLQQLQGHGQSD